MQAPQAAPPAGYYYPELIAHSVVVTNFREIFNDHIGAHILALVLAFARGLHTFIPQQLRREWKKSPSERGDVVHLPEATALIVGVGGIGSEAARLLSAFGVTVLGTDARRTKAPDGVAELHRPEALDELLPRADFVILTVPHTPATEGFFDRARFQRMKPTSFFINIGRGMTTKLDDLVTVLEAGEIGGAALDVYEQEPLPPDQRLWTLPNVAPYGRARALPQRPAVPDHSGQLPGFRRRTRIAQCGGQVVLVLSRESSHSGGNSVAGGEIMSGFCRTRKSRLTTNRGASSDD